MNDGIALMNISHPVKKGLLNRLKNMLFRPKLSKDVLVSWSFDAAKSPYFNLVSESDFLKWAENSGWLYDPIKSEWAWMSTMQIARNLIDYPAPNTYTMTYSPQFGKNLYACKSLMPCHGDIFTKFIDDDGVCWYAQTKTDG